MSEPAETRCPACRATDGHIFYRATHPVPVHSVLLMDTRDEALAYPCRELELWFCDACGFVHNRRFDASVHEYSPRCEESQAFSGTFNRFARHLAEDYVQRYAPRVVLEIGCGKGDFLLGLCDLGRCRGIGIDPGVQPERVREAARGRIEWIVDFYDARYAHLQADLVLCRHTLEHIGPVGEFIRSVRNAVGDDPSTVVAFEVPDLERILLEDGFWDIYYEHCSYFTLGSLARLFEREGFRIERLEKCFGDQYLLLDARPGEPAPHPLEDDLERTRLQIARFQTSVTETIDGWRRYFADAHAAGEKVALWGSGSKAVAFVTTLGLGGEVACVTDVNPYRHGRFLPGSGHEIVPPEALRALRPDRVVAMNPIYLDEIGADLRAMGLTPALTAVGSEGATA